MSLEDEDLPDEDFDDGDSDDETGDGALWELFDSPTAHYNPERDGTLEEYLMPQLEGQLFRLFHGLKDFQRLRDEEWLLPGTSYLRFMHNIGRGDAHYLVTTDWRLEGMDGGMHSGDAGVFELEQIFTDAPPFEIGNVWGPAYERYLDHQEAAARLRLTQQETSSETTDVLKNED